MKKLLLLIFFKFLCIFSTLSQERIEISGTIVVPVNYNSSGVHVYNKSSGKGSVSDAEGNFELRVQEGDSVYFTALQFKELLVIVDSGVVEKKRLVVEIFEGINELPEVVVRPHNLTGNLDIDASNIETVEVELPTMSAFSINDYDWEFRPDSQTGVVNAAMPSGNLMYGADPFAILGGLIGLILPPKKEKKQQPSTRTAIGQIQLEREIRSRYNDEFFLEVLKIEKERISDFIEHLNAIGFAEELLKKERELDLIQFMVDESEEFNQS